MVLAAVPWYTLGMRLRAILVIALVLPCCISAQARYDGRELALRIVDMLIGDYDRSPTVGVAEAVVKRFGRGTYLGVLRDWVGSRGHLADYEPAMDPAYRIVLDTVRRELPALYPSFETTIVDLVKLSVHNYELYHEALSALGPPVPAAELDMDDLYACIVAPGFSDRLLAMIAEEEAMKGYVRWVMTRPEVEAKLRFFVTLYDLIARLRQRDIQRYRDALAAAGG